MGFKTLILDLDETLIHLIKDNNIPYDFSINLKFEDEIEEMRIIIRPGAI